MYLEIKYCDIFVNQDFERYLDKGFVNMVLKILLEKDNYNSRRFIWEHLIKNIMFTSFNHSDKSSWWWLINIVMNQYIKKDLETITDNLTYSDLYISSLVSKTFIDKFLRTKDDIYDKDSLEYILKDSYFQSCLEEVCLSEYGDRMYSFKIVWYMSNAMFRNI